MAISVQRYGPDTGGAYIDVFTVPDRKAVMHELRLGAGVCGKQIIAHVRLSRYPEFDLLWVRLRGAAGEVDDHAFRIPTR